MPISQSRMLTLINAALDYQQALDTFNTAVSNAAHRATQETALYELQTLGVMANPIGQLSRPTDSPVAIAVEYQHFKSFGARNRAEAVRQARRRGKLANPPPLPPEFTKRGSTANSAPITLQPPNHQQGRSIASAVDAELARPRDPDPRVTAEDLARFNAQLEEDRKRDAGFSLDFALAPATAKLDDTVMTEIEAEVERELARAKHEARSAELARQGGQQAPEEPEV